MYMREVDIREMMANGANRKEICEVLGHKWKVAPKTIETQYYHLINEMAEAAEHERAELRANLMARQDSIFKKSMQEGKYKVALDATIAQAKLGGLHDTVKADERTSPEMITVAERDYSGPVLVGDSAVNDEE